MCLYNQVESSLDFFGTEYYLNNKFKDVFFLSNKHFQKGFLSSFNIISFIILLSKKEQKPEISYAVRHAKF